MAGPLKGVKLSIIYIFECRSTLFHVRNGEVEIPFHVICMGQKKHNYFLMLFVFVSYRNHFIVWEGKYLEDSRSESNLLKYLLLTNCI